MEVSHTWLKKCNTAHLDCLLPTESRLCVGLTESRTQHRRVAEYESDSQHFVCRDACESTQSESLLSPSGNRPLRKWKESDSSKNITRSEVPQKKKIGKVHGNIFRTVRNKPFVFPEDLHTVKSSATCVPKSAGGPSVPNSTGSLMPRRLRKTPLLK